MGNQPPRKILFIDRKFQASFILKFIALLCVGTALFCVAAYFILDRRLGDTFYSAHLTIQTVGDMLLPTLVWLSLTFVVLLGLAVLSMTLVVSHLIAGPLYAIRRYLDFLSEGRLDFDARLRAKDQTTPLAVALSRSLDVLNEKITSIQALSDGIDSASQKILDGARQEQGAGEELVSAASSLAELSSKLSKETSYFKTRPVEPKS